MPLNPDSLSQRLENEWLAEPFPGSVFESADRFAGATAGWFVEAISAGFPVLTAVARRPSLTATAAPALAAGLGGTSGQLLALAVAGYLAGQTFGAGVASFPTAFAAGAAGFTAAFNNLKLSPSARAQQIAVAVYAMAVSTLVVFPTPLPPAPIL